MCVEGLRAKYTPAGAVEDTPEPDGCTLLSVVVTKRRRRQLADRVTQVSDLRGGAAVWSVGEVLRLTPTDVDRVLIAGRRLFDTIDELRTWAMDRLPDGWTPGAHWLPSVDAPVLRYVRPDGRKVELIPATVWFGKGAEVADVADIAAAWRALGRIVADRFGVRYLMPTPATTGRECLLASLPRGHEWPVLDAGTRELVTSTSGQGRMELLGPAVDLDQLAEVDARFAYGALARLVPVGTPDLHDGEPSDPMRQARVRCTWHVPADWHGPGLLPSKGEHRTWRYASTPGEQAAGWVDGAELHVARRHGWAVEVHETLEWDGQGAQPLRTWATKLREARAAVDRSTVDGALVRAALRNLLITAVGALVGRPYRTTRWAPIGSPELVPAGALNVRHQAGAIIYDLATANTWRDQLAHPEWAASIWGRTRARMLDGPGPDRTRTGLLHLPPGVTAVAVAVDALYLDGDPGWVDDGADGRLRLKATWPGPHHIKPGRTAFYDYVRGLR